MHNPSDTFVTAFGALLCFVWGLFSSVGWFMIRGGNESAKGRGLHMVVDAGGDTAALIDEIPKLPFVDGTYGWIPGQFEFQIPLSFRILRQSNLHKTFSGPTQTNTFFAFSAQKYHLDATGTLSIEKFSIRTTCDTNRVIAVTTIP